MVVLGFRITDRSLLRGLGRRFGQFRKQAMLDMAAFWHREVFPRHFGSSNRSAYGFAPRKPLYLDVIKRKKGSGVGRFRDLVLTGQSQRWMQAFVKISGTAQRVTVRMFPPRYFTNPFIGTYTDPRTGRVKRVTRQPDKPDEVTRFNAQDRRDLRLFVARRLQEQIDAARTPPHTTTIK